MDTDQTTKPPIERFAECISDTTASIQQVPLDKYSLGPWSMSKLKVLQKCPFQFYLKYVLKLKVPQDVAGREDTQSADVGTAAHLVLEHVMQGVSLDHAFAMAKPEFVPGKLSEDTWVEKVLSLEHSVSAFKERIDALGARHKIKKVYTELRVGVTREWQPCGFFHNDVYIRGVIDLCILLDNGDVVIIDHKTGGGEGSIRPYEDQLNSYKALFHFGVRPVRGAQSFIHFIAAGEVKPSTMSQKEEIESKIRQLLEFSIEGAIDNVSELGFFKHKRGSYCKWCDYDSVCKPGYVKDAEKDTKRFFQGISITTLS